MRYVDEFRDGDLARGLAARIRAAAVPGRDYRIMEFCGGHTHTISRYGLEDLLPTSVRLIHGPGCPVCVLPIGRLDMALELAARPGLILCCYGDVMRVPASKRDSLLQAKARGADVRIIYSSLDAVAVARANPDREVVFFAIGFETTTPPTALALKRAKELGLANFSVFCNHVLTPSAIAAILGAADAGGNPIQVDGFIGPGHVSIVTGTDVYRPFAERHGKPIVISGFEPLDVLASVERVIAQLNTGRAEVENQYSRAVTGAGNLRAKAVIAETLSVRDRFEWRGLGVIPESGLAVNEAFAEFDAERRFALAERSVADHPACECAAVLRGETRPQECRIFGTGCTPEMPVGSCMVSAEGACAAHYLYGRFRDRAAARSAAVDA